jgi:hypothetical protein
MRKVDIGKTSCRLDVALKCFAISALAPAGMEDASVLLITDMMPPMEMMNFLRKGQLLGASGSVEEKEIIICERILSWSWAGTVCCSTLFSCSVSFELPSC